MPRTRVSTMDLLAIVVTVLVGILSLLSLFIYLFYQNKYGYWKRRGVPGPKPSIPYGNFPSMFSRHISKPINELYKEYKHLPFIGIYSLWYPVLIINDLDLIKSVLIRNMPNFNSHGWYVNEKVEPLSAHIFSLEGKEWRDLRIKFSPAFSTGKTKMMYTNMMQVAKTFEEYLHEQKKKKDIFDFRHEFNLFTSDNITNTVFGLEANTFQNGFSKIAEYAHQLFLPTDFIGRIVIMLMVLAPKILYKFNLKLWGDYLTKFFVTLVDDTIESRERTGTERNDFIQVLMDMKNNKLKDDQGNSIDQDDIKLTSVQMAAQAFLFFQAGYDTSSSASSFALYQLALHQDVQSRVRKEILETLERHGGECTYEALMEMKYLYAVIEETLRLHPPLHFLFRQCTEDYTIPGTDIVIEKGTHVYIPNLGTQMDPQYFEDPEKFNPERFLPENKNNIIPFTYLPFGEGPRICPGQKFGILQSALALVSVLKNYNVSPCDKTDIPVKEGGSPILFEPKSIILKMTEV